MSLDLDEQYIKEGYRLIVGTDEAGRGCLLGPVFLSRIAKDTEVNAKIFDDLWETVVKDKNISEFN